jgi:hypothetical protein
MFAIPASHRILSCAIQNDKVTMWVLVDPTSPKVLNFFMLLGTGHTSPVTLGNFIGTIQDSHGFVFSFGFVFSYLDIKLCRSLAIWLCRYLGLRKESYN